MDWSHPHYREYLILQNSIFEMWCADGHRKRVHLAEWRQFVRAWEARQIEEQTGLEIETVWAKLEAEVLQWRREKRRPISQEDVSAMLRSPEFRALIMIGTVFVTAIIWLTAPDGTVSKPDLYPPDQEYEYSGADLDWLERQTPLHNFTDNFRPVDGP